MHLNYHHVSHKTIYNIFFILYLHLGISTNIFVVAPVLGRNSHLKVDKNGSKRLGFKMKKTRVLCDNDYGSRWGVECCEINF